MSQHLLSVYLFLLIEILTLESSRQPFPPLCFVCVLSRSWIFPLWQPLGQLCKMLQLHYGGKYDKPATLPISVSPLCFQPGVRCLRVHSESGSSQTIDGTLRNIPPSAFSVPLWHTDFFLVQVMGINCRLMYHCANEQPRLKAAVLLTLGLDFGHNV